MGKIIRHTDLAGEEPGPRADVDLPLEHFEFEASSDPSVPVDEPALASFFVGFWCAGLEDLESL
jgi:hypothetical protein